MRSIRGVEGLFVVVALVVASPRARAQEPVVISFEDYLARVVDAEPTFLSSEARVAAVEATVGVARRRPIPSATVGLAQFDVSGQGAPTASLVAVDLPIELGGDRRARVDGARAGIDMVEAELERERRQHRIDASLAYVAAFVAESELEVRIRLLEGFEHVARLDAIRAERGEIVEARALRSAIELERARAEMRSAEGDVATTRAALARWVLAREPLRADTHDPLLGENAPSDSRALLEEALRTHPDLRVAETRIELARASLAMTRARRVVDPTLRAEWQHNRSTSEPQFRQNPNDTLALLLTVPMPISAPRRSEAALAAAMLDEAEAIREVVRRRVESDIEVALANERRAEARAHAYVSELEPRARALVEAETRAYERDASTAFELMAARRVLEEVALEAVDARAALARARILRRAVTTGAP